MDQNEKIFLIKYGINVMNNYYISMRFKMKDYSFLFREETPF